MIANRKMGGILNNAPNTRKQGFTLIELLAVIVILAIIALISTPIILNLINTAKKGAVLISGKNYIDSLEKTLLAQQLNVSESLQDGVYSIKDLVVEYEGNGPTEGVVYIENQKVTKAKMCINNYSIDYNDSKSKMSDNNYCKNPKLTIKVDGNNNEIELTDSLVYNYDLTEENLNNITNISCNNMAIPSLENNKLTINNVFGDTTCFLNNSIIDAISNADETLNNIIMIKDEQPASIISVGADKNIHLNLNNNEIISPSAIINEGIFEIESGQLLFKDWGLFNRNSSILSISNVTMDAKRLAIYSTSENGPNLKNLEVHCDGTTNQCINISLNTKRESNISNLTINNEGSILAFYHDDGVININNIYITSPQGHAIWNMNGILNLNGNIYFDSYAGIELANKGVVNINGSYPKFDSQGNYLKGTYIHTLVATSIVSKAGTVNIHGGLIESPYRVIASANSSSTDETTFGTLNIDGDTYIKKTSSQYEAVLAYNNGVVNVNGNPAVFDNNGNYLSGVYIESETVGIRSTESGKINLCGATISSKNEPFYIKNSGYIHYTPNVKFINSNSFYDANNPSHIILENKLECK